VLGRVELQGGSRRYTCGVSHILRQDYASDSCSGTPKTTVKSAFQCAQNPIGQYEEFWCMPQEAPVANSTIYVTEGCQNIGNNVINNRLTQEHVERDHRPWEEYGAEREGIN